MNSDQSKVYMVEPPHSYSKLRTNKKPNVLTPVMFSSQQSDFSLKRQGKFCSTTDRLSSIKSTGFHTLYYVKNSSDTPKFFSQW